MNFCIIYFWQQRKSHASSYWLIIVCSTCMKVLNSATYIRALFPWSFQFLRIWRNSLQTPQKRWVWVQVSRDVLLLTGAADQPDTKRTLTASLGSWSHRQLATSLGTLTQEKKKKSTQLPRWSVQKCRAKNTFTFKLSSQKTAPSSCISSVRAARGAALHRAAKGAIIPTRSFKNP